MLCTTPSQCASNRRRWGDGERTLLFLLKKVVKIKIYSFFKKSRTDISKIEKGCFQLPCHYIEENKNSGSIWWISGAEEQLEELTSQCLQFQKGETRAQIGPVMVVNPSAATKETIWHFLASHRHRIRKNRLKRAPTWLCLWLPPFI